MGSQPVRIVEENKVTSLKCPKCGNDSRFLQVMEDVANLVDGDRNHLHQIDGSIAYYRCVRCDAVLDDE